MGSGEPKHNSVIKRLWNLYLCLQSDAKLGVRYGPGGHPTGTNTCELLPNMVIFFLKILTKDTPELAHEGDL